MWASRSPKRPLTICFSFFFCSTCRLFHACRVCALSRCLFHLFHFIWCRFEICVYCVYYCVDFVCTVLVGEMECYLFYSVCVRSIVLCVLVACVFFSFGISLFTWSLVVVCAALLFLSFLIFISFHSVFTVLLFAIGPRIYVARTSSHRYTMECISVVWVFTIYSTHAISMD